jgi:hypothetical protein
VANVPVTRVGRKFGEPICVICAVACIVDSPRV